MNLGYNIHPGRSLKEFQNLFELTLGGKFFDALEITYPFHNPLRDAASVDNYLQAIQNAKENFSPKISLHPPLDLDLAYPNRNIRRAMVDELKKVLEFAQSQGASIIALHPGTICLQDFSGQPDFPLRKFIQNKNAQMLEDTLEGVLELSDFLVGSGMILAVENLIHTYDITCSPEKLDNVVAAVNRDNVQALVDVGHAYLLGYEPGDFIRNLKSRLAHTHFHDNNGTCDQHMYPGRGCIDFENLFSALKERKYAGTLLCEIPTEDPEEMVKVAKFLIFQMSHEDYILNGEPSADLKS